MRSTSRLLAAVSQSSKFLEAGAPTGLTGLATHASPRTALLYAYSTTLDKLKHFPEHSVYRKSTEALTKHRMSIIESIKPAGLEEWQSRVKSLVEQHPNAFRQIAVAGGSGYNIVWKQGAEKENPDAEKLKKDLPVFEFGPYESKEQADANLAQFTKAMPDRSVVTPEIEAEPLLTAEQIGEIEQKINAGLLEEIIEVAEGENALASTLYSSQVWEDLEEKPVEGQWTYYTQDKGTAGKGTRQ